MHQRSATGTDYVAEDLEPTGETRKSHVFSDPGSMRTEPESDRQRENPGAAAVAPKQPHGGAHHLRFRTLGPLGVLLIFFSLAQ